MFTRAYGDAVENFFNPLQVFLIHSERFMTQTPWPIIMLLIGALAWYGSRSIKIVVGSLLALFVIGLFDMWDDTMKTISMIFVCAVLAIVLDNAVYGLQVQGVPRKKQAEEAMR